VGRTYVDINALTAAVKSDLDRAAYAERQKLRSEKTRAEQDAQRASDEVSRLRVLSRSKNARQARADLKKTEQDLQRAESLGKELEVRALGIMAAADDVKKWLDAEIPHHEKLARRIGFYSPDQGTNKALASLLDEQHPRHVFFKIAWYLSLIIVVFSAGYLALLLLRALPFAGATDQMNAALKQFANQAPPSRDVAAALSRQYSGAAGALPRASVLVALGLGTAVAAGAVLPTLPGPKAEGIETVARALQRSQSQTKSGPESTTTDPSDEEDGSTTEPEPPPFPTTLASLSEDDVTRIADKLAGRVPSAPDVTGIERTVNGLRQSATKLDGDVARLDAVTRSIDGRVYAVEGTTARINGKVNGLETDVHQVNADVQKVSTRVEDVDNSVAMSNLAKPGSVWPDWLGRDRYRASTHAARTLAAYLGDRNGVVLAVRSMGQEDLPKNVFLKRFKAVLAATSGPSADALYAKYRNVALNAARVPR
jgi:hypothetical protein